MTLMVFLCLGLNIIFQLLQRRELFFLQWRILDATAAFKFNILEKSGWGKSYVDLIHCAYIGAAQNNSNTSTSLSLVNI